MRLQHKAILAGLLGGVCYWLLDAAIDWLVFYEGTFLHLLLLGIPAHEVYMRLLGFIMFLGFGLVIGRVASKREEAKQALLESEESSRSIIESSPLGMHIYKLEPDGRLIFRGANPAAERILGINNSKFIGQKIEQIFPPLAQSELPQIYRQVAAEGKAWKTDEFAYDDGQIKGFFEVHAFQIAPGKMVAVFRDVTERKQSQKEISRLAKFPSENPNPVLRISRDGNLLYSNQASAPLLKAWDYHEGQPLPEKWRKFVTAAIASGHGQKTELECDQQIFSLTFAPIADSDYVNVYALDITDRKKAEESLQTRESDQALILRSVPLVLYSAEVSGEFTSTWLSGHVEELTGIPGYRFIEEGGLWASRLHPDDKQKAISTFKGILSTDSFVMEYRWRHADGSYLWFLDQAFLVRDEKGQPKEIIGTWVDISEHKRAEEALRISEEKFSKSFHSSPDSITITSVDSGQILEINEGFEKMFGYSRDEVLGKTTIELKLWQNAQDREAMLKEFEDKSRVKDLEIHIRDKAGNIHDCLFSCDVIDIDAKPCLVATTRDITEHKQAEEALRTIIEGTSKASQKDFFNVLVKSFANTFGFKYAIAGELVGVDQDRVKTLAVWADGNFGENFEYSLVGTPCDDIVNKGLCFYPKGVQEQFPEDQQLIEMGVESYLGTPLFDKSGKVLGLLAIMDTEPKEEASLATKIMPVFAARASVEIERKQAEEEISRLAKFPSENPNPVLRISSKGMVLYCNQASQPLLNYWQHKQDHPIATKWLEPVTDALNSGQSSTIEVKCDDQTLSLTFTPVINGDYVNIYGLDITERKQAEERLRFSQCFLEISNRHVQMKPLLKEFVDEVKDFTGCTAVGIRILDEQGNIPYEVYQGFSRKFYESENFLSIKNHQCMCINVITGQADPELPFYTKGGSFYINGTTRFLATVPAEQKGQTRNVCNEEGFESVALFPIRLGERILGLIHVADKRENMFPLDVAKTLENAAIQLGTAIQRVWAEEALRKTKDALEIRVRQRTADLSRTVDELEAEVEDRILAEKKLEHERRRLHSVLQMLPGYVILHGADHKIRFANDRFLELFGEPGNRPCYDIMMRQDQPCDTCQVSNVLKNQALQEWEWTCQDGRTFHVWGYPFTDVDQAQVMLELGIDITDRKNLETEVLRISEAERQRIGQDLHDSLSQTLGGISCLSQVLHNKLAAKSLAEAAEAKKIELLITDSVTLTHSLAKGLVPVGVEPESLMSALKDLAANVSEMFKIHCIFQCEEPVLIEDKNVATHTYRIAQEAINNAVRHSQAQKITISLTLSNGAAVLSIEDDGQGISEDVAPREGMGLSIMNYRASKIGASLSVRPRSQGGTIVVCRLKQTTKRRAKQ